MDKRINLQHAEVQVATSKARNLRVRRHPGDVPQQTPAHGSPSHGSGPAQQLPQHAANKHCPKSGGIKMGLGKLNWYKSHKPQLAASEHLCFLLPRCIRIKPNLVKQGGGMSPERKKQASTQICFLFQQKEQTTAYWNTPGSV